MVREMAEKEEIDGKGNKADKWWSWLDANVDMAHIDTNDVEELDPSLKNKRFLRLLNIFQKQYN